MKVSIHKTTFLSKANKIRQKKKKGVFFNSKEVYLFLNKLMENNNFNEEKKEITPAQMN